MTRAVSAIFSVVFGLIPILCAGENLQKARDLERSGQVSDALAVLARAAESAPNDVTALREYAEFLDSYGDAGSVKVYRRLLAALDGKDASQRATVAGRLVQLDLLAGDSDAARRDAEAYRAASGKALALPAPPKAPQDQQYIAIPGPLRSFARMAAVSSDMNRTDLLAMVARNVVTNGYQASHSNDALEPTEYLKLVTRYLSQARELEKLAGEEKVIRIENCESPKTGELLRILGFRMRGGCGSEVVLETVNATRAFLTTDSGFPLPDLEQALRTDRPFQYDFHPTQAAVLFSPEYWIPAKEKGGMDFIDVFLGDPSLCRLYLGFSKLDPETAAALDKAIPMHRIKAYGHVLDFFGGMFEIRGGKAVVPGGARAAAAWAEVTGVSPERGAAFFERLLTRDDGWMASYYDTLARVQGPVRDYLTDPARLKRFYSAIRGRVTSPGPARPVFRSNSELMLFTARLWLDPDGRPHIPGGIETWKNLFVKPPQGKYDSKLTKAAANWKEPDDILEALFALGRKAVENEPLKIFMALSDLDRLRDKPLQPATVDRLAREYRRFGNQYSVFSNAPGLSDASIVQFLDTATAVEKIRDQMLRSDTAGTLQGLIGLWEIFARQRVLPASHADAVFAELLKAFAQIHNDEDLFDAGRSGVKQLLEATGFKSDATPQEHIVDLLAGSARPSDVETHTEVVQEIVRILEAQRIVSLDSVFALADHLESLAGGAKLNMALLNRLSARVAEIQLPRASLSSAEKNAMSFGYWTERHIEEERKLNLRAVIEKAVGNPEKLRAARGLLTPFLRDVLVAYNYAEYAPPGAQILYTNPLFVRNHDFLGVQGSSHTWRTTEVQSAGWPSNAGGRLVGSLTGLPYALAEAEQNFLIPKQTQALIWGDLVPQMLVSAKVPRWWNVTPRQLHWVGLTMRYARSLMAESAIDPRLREDILEVLRRQAYPARTQSIEVLLSQGEVKQAIDKITPSELFFLGTDMAARRKSDAQVHAAEMRRLAAEFPEEVKPRAISRAFGTPKPTLANSYVPELLHLRTFPTLMGYSSRILAESWESNTLYWAELADEMHLRPSQLNVQIPAWTQNLVERIFASHLEDWPAVLQSLRAVGAEARARTGITEEDEKASLR